VTAVGVGVGIYLQSPGDDGSPAPSTGADEVASTLADVDTTTMVVRRQGFCDHVDNDEVTAALGGAATGASSYGDGDRTDLGEITDVAQEYGCAWTGPKGASAHAWVFAPPVTHAWARRMTGRTPEGCQEQHGPAYGSPSTAYTCTSKQQTTVSLRGLFGDAWLSCDLTGARREPAAAVRERASRWCLATAVAAG